MTSSTLKILTVTLISVAVAATPTPQADTTPTELKPSQILLTRPLPPAPDPDSKPAWTTQEQLSTTATANPEGNDRKKGLTSSVPPVEKRSEEDDSDSDSDSDDSDERNPRLPGRQKRSIPDDYSEEDKAGDTTEDSDIPVSTDEDWTKKKRAVPTADGPDDDSSESREK